MACGLPVLAAESTGATNLVRDKVTGTLVDGTEVEEFADALEAYARDPDLRRRHGEAGLAIAKTMDWDSINATVIRAYKHEPDTSFGVAMDLGTIEILKETDQATFWQTPYYVGWEGVLIRYDSPDEERVRDVIERSRNFVAAKPMARPRKRK